MAKTKTHDRPTLSTAPAADTPVAARDASGMAQWSLAFLFEFLEGAVQEENERVDDVHAVAIDGRRKFREESSHESGNMFSMIDRVLEPAGNRSVIDEAVAELKTRFLLAPVKIAASCRPPAKPASAAVRETVVAKVEHKSTDGDDIPRVREGLAVEAVWEIEVLANTLLEKVCPSSDWVDHEQEMLLRCLGLRIKNLSDVILCALVDSQCTVGRLRRKVFGRSDVYQSAEVAHV